MRTAFVEVRDSKLLKTPLRLSGEYLRPRADTWCAKCARLMPRPPRFAPAKW